MPDTNSICEVLESAKQAALNSKYLKANPEEYKKFIAIINKIMEEKHCDGRRRK